MSREVLAIDVDEVQFPFVPSFAEYNNQEYGTNLRPDDFLSYYFEDILQVPTEEVTRRVHAFHERDDLHVEPLIGAAEAIGELALRYDLVVVTARHPRFELRTTTWIQNRIGDYFSEFRHVGYSGSKIEVCRQIGAKVLIDDSPNYIRSCAGTDIEGVLFGDYNWNRSEPLPPSAVRAVDWGAVLEHFDARS